MTRLAVCWAHGGEASGSGVMPCGGSRTHLMPGLQGGKRAQWLKSLPRISMEDLGVQNFLCSNHQTFFLESQAVPSYPRCNSTAFAAAELRLPTEPFERWDCPSWAPPGLPLPLPSWSLLWWTLPLELGGYRSVPDGVEEGDTWDTALHCPSLKPMLVTWH